MLRLLTFIVILALIIYYGAVFLQIFGVIKFTYEPIKFKKLLIPFYYLIK
jgi:hypothetical protein